MKNRNQIRNVSSALLIIILTAINSRLSAQGISVSFTVSDYSGYNISCHGDSSGFIQATVSGGTAPYTFLWNTGDSISTIAGFPAGTYVLTVTDSHNTIVTDSVVLSEPNPVSVLLSSSLCHTSPDYNICNPHSSEGTIYSTVTGGAGGYTYNWSTGDAYSTLTNVPAGHYKLYITDNNNCIDSGHITVHEPPLLRIAKGKLKPIGTDTNATSCIGIPAHLELTLAGGIPPYSTIVYQTSPSANVNSYDSSGIEIFNIPYQVTYISIGLLDSAGNEVDTAITLNPVPPITMTVTPVVYANGRNESCYNCNNGEIIISNISGGISPYSTNLYTIIGGNDSLIMRGGDTLKNIIPNSYLYQVTDAIGCQSGLMPLQISDAYQGDQLQIILNATGSSFNPTYNTCNGVADGSIRAVVVGGTYPYSYHWTSGDTTQNLINKTAGVYALTVIDAAGDTAISDSAYLIHDPAIQDTLVAQHYGYGGGDVYYGVSTAGASDGAITAYVNGGFGGYTYLWSNGSNNAYVSGFPAGTYWVTITDYMHCTKVDSITLVAPLPLTIESITHHLHQSTDISCYGGNDGSITIKADGGYFPLQYTLNNSSGLYWSGYFSSFPFPSDTVTIQSLPAGNYTLQIISNGGGSPVDTTITITQPPAIGFNVTQLQYANGYNVTCYYCMDAAMQVTGTNGVAPYTFQWYHDQYGIGTDTLFATGDSIDNAPGGNYRLVVTDANGCSLLPNPYYNVNASQPSYLGLQLTINSQNVLCFGDSTGSMTAIVTGGTPPYSSYQWSNGATSSSISNLPAGVGYQVTVTDSHGDWISNGAALSQPYSISISSASSYYTGGYNISVCGDSDGTITASASGGAWGFGYVGVGFGYSWSNGSTDQSNGQLKAGIYTLTVTDGNGCTLTQTDTLTQPPPMHVDSITATTYNGGFNISCNGNSDGAIYLAVSGGVPSTGGLVGSFYNYAWSNGQGGYWNSRNIQNAPAGHYTVQITDANGAEIDTGITLSQPGVLSLVLNATRYGNGTNMSCFSCTDGNVSAGITGGVAPFSYQWLNAFDSLIATSDSLLNVGPGQYIVNITDANGCALQGSTWLMQPPQSSWSLQGNANTDSSDFIGTTDSTDLVMKTKNTEIMRVAANGNVGIGTTTPNEKLDICGILRAKEVLVEDSSWCDFVFDENYQRMGLLEKENYLKANKHLPYILSAKDIEQTGLKVGTTLNGVTQNIEEMNLDLIELFKMIESLTKENVSLKARIALLEQKQGK